MNKHEWLLKRNCSLTPRQLGLAYAVLCIASFSVAGIFTLSGAWQVMVFAVIEMLAVAIAFLHYARHATDHEHISLCGDCLLIENVEAGQTRETRLNACWTRVASPSRPQDLICLQAGGIKVTVGRFATDRKRREVAREIQRELRSALLPQGQAS